jgi:hypothetical protein
VIGGHSGSGTEHARVGRALDFAFVVRRALPHGSFPLAPTSLTLPLHPTRFHLPRRSLLPSHNKKEWARTSPRRLVRIRLDAEGEEG